MKKNVYIYIYIYIYKSEKTHPLPLLHSLPIPLPLPKPYDIPGLYPSPGQLPPFSSILPFRPHPGAPPAFPPTFPSALGLLSSQSLPVTSHADLLTKHPIFGAMNMALGGPQVKGDNSSSLFLSYTSGEKTASLKKSFLFLHRLYSYI